MLYNIYIIYTHLIYIIVWPSIEKKIKLQNAKKNSRSSSYCQFHSNYNQHRNQ